LVWDLVIGFWDFRCHNIGWVRAGSLAVLVVILSGCRSPETTGTSRPVEQAWFTDEAESTGLAFVHENGMSGHRYIAEVMAPGVALFDFDNDGDLDVYVVQGQPIGSSATQSANQRRGDRLFRNDLRIGADGVPALHFTDITQQAHIDQQTYGMGVATGDVDNDGWTDLLLTRLNGAVLLRNDGNGTFSDITATAGLTSSTWSVPASFFDFDRDGWLDLYVGNYIRYSTESDVGCFAATGAPDYCRPQNFATLPGRLYRNRGNGTFADVTVAAGLSRDFGPALGSIAFDANGDGWPDLYVANDGSENQLWVNRKNGTFENRAVVAGVAVNGAGRAEGSMGVDAADYDDDGDEDLVVTNLTGEGSTLYANDGSGLFTDVAAMAGLRSATLRSTGFGAFWMDFDNDGALDILTVNGAVQTIQALAQAGDPFPLRQPKQLFRNTRDGRFTDVTGQAGRVFGLAEVSRGAAFGDIDNDGDIDVVVGNNNGPLQLLVNHIGNRRPWLGVRVTGPVGRDMPGAKITLQREDGHGPMRHVHSDGSYASANDPRVLFGLGDAKALTGIRVQWPDSRLEEWSISGVNRWITLKQGSGRAIR